MADLLAREFTVAGYRIEGLIGHGFSGESYRATQLALARPVALTVVDPKLAADESFRVRFLAAMRLAASLDHPNVVPVHEVGEEGGRLFVVSAYVEGDDLARVLARAGKLEPRRAADIVAQAADAMAAAHARGLVHGSLRAENVVLRRSNSEEQVLVGGFGFAAEEADEGADVESLENLLIAAVAGEASPPNFPAELPAELVAPLRRACATDPKARFGSAAELARALDYSVEEAAAPPRRRRRTVLAATAALLLVLGAIAGGFAAVDVLQKDDDPPPKVSRPAPVRAGTLGEPVVLASPPGPMAVGEGHLWVVNWGERRETLTKVDPRINDVVGIPVPLEGFMGGLAAGEGAVWAATESGVVRVDSGTLEVEAPIDVGGLPYELAVGEGAVWALVAVGDQWRRETLARIDPVTGRVTRQPLAFDEPENPEEEEWHLLVAEGSVWVAATALGEVLQVDPADGRVERIDVGGAPDSLAAVAGTVWVGSDSRQSMSRIDPRNGQIIGKPVIPSDGVVGLASDGAALWLLTQEGALRRIDPDSARIVGRSLLVGPSSVQIGALVGGDGGLWVIGEGETVRRVITAPELPPPDSSAVHTFTGPGPWTLPGWAAVPAGSYRTDEFQVPFSFRLADGWRDYGPENQKFVGVIEDAPRGVDTGSVSFFIVERVFSPDASRELPLPQDLVAWLRSHPHLTTTVKDVMVGDLRARQVDVRVRATPKPNPPECHDDPCVLLFRVAENLEWAVAPGWIDRFVILEVGGETVAISYGSPRDGFKAFAPKADAVLDTVTFGQP